MYTKPISSILFPLLAFVLIFLMNDIVVAQEENPLAGLSAVSNSDIQDSAIDFVNTTSSPGLGGATLHVNNAQRDSDQWRSNLGFNAEITLKNHIFNAYWGLGLVGGSLKDSIRLTADNGQPVVLNLERNITSLRGSLGLSFPINQHLKLLPVLTLAISNVQTKTAIDGLFNINNNPTTATFNNGAQVASTTGSIDALYWYWYDNYKLEVSAHYNLIYNNVFSKDNPVLNINAWSQTAQIKSRISGPTSLITSARPWRWLIYVNHTNFINQSTTSLGYTGLYEIGTGLEWQVNVKPLDWFGWQYVGFSAGIITSKNVEGFNIGLTAR